MELNFYLQQLIIARWHDLNQNWTRFMHDIRDNDPDDLTVDRRKLQQLSVDNKFTTLNIIEIETLQKYFVTVGLIQPHENFIFRAPDNLLDALHGEKAMTVFYRSHYLQTFNMEGASNWDVRAFEELQRTSEIADLRVELRDAFHDLELPSTPAALKKKLSAEPWYRVLNEEKALVSIGAPVSCYASEEMLCRMFRIPPYEPRGLGAEHRLPFYLYWPGLEDAEAFSNSSFSVTREELEIFYPDQFEQLGPNTRAILIGDTLYPARTVGDSMNLVIAQYWNGHLALVLLGIFAPATFAIAKCVAERRITATLGPYRYNELPPGSEEDVQPILINLISTKITKRARARGKKRGPARDTRQLSNKRMVSWQKWQCVGGGYEMLEERSY